MFTTENRVKILLGYRIVIVEIFLSQILIIERFILIVFFIEVNWGSSSQAHSYRNALVAMHKLQWTEEHIKNYRFKG